jgi:hypothetical protein
MDGTEGVYVMEEEKGFFPFWKSNLGCPRRNDVTNLPRLLGEIYSLKVAYRRTRRKERRKCGHIYVKENLM